jgi:hemolysin III
LREADHLVGQKVRAVRTVVRAQRIKPLLRGVLDVLACMVAIPATALLIASADGGVAKVAAVVYGLSLVALFGISATYHTPWWPRDVRLVLRRLDHSTIYVLIAGSYTPVALVALEPPGAVVLLCVVWLGVVAGFLKSFLWPTSPRWLNTGVYLLLGWIVVPFLPELIGTIGWRAFALLIGGGLLYTVGAVIYTRRQPDPYPRIFGYHEVFHLFVVAASGCHFVAMWHVLVTSV